MIPVGIVGKTKYRAYMTFWLIVVNVLVFLWELTLMAQGEQVFGQAMIKYAMNVCAIGQESIVIITRNSLYSMFLHGSLLHILGNMIFLWLFAPRVEEYFGHKKFLIFYLLSGFGASVGHTLLGGVVCSTTNPYAGLAIGASGAIAGVMGAFLFLYPGAKIETIILFIARFRIPAFVYLIFFFLTDLFNGLDASKATNVAHWAHVGGFVTGFAILFIATLFKPAPKGDPFAHLDE